MPKLEISKEQARQYLLLHQGLWAKNEFAGKAGILDFISRVGCIQYDPLNIVGQNHELVLQARIRSFQRDMLYGLLYENRKLLDSWDKNMSIIGVEDWPYFRRLRDKALQIERGKSSDIEEILPKVLKDIAVKGPVTSADLEYNRQVDWWWGPTKLARAALETLYLQGKLIVHRKVYTRKVYDLTERHLPADLLNAPEPNPTDEEYYDWYVLRRIGSIGLLWNRAGDAWLGIAGLKSPQRNLAFDRLSKAGLVDQIAVEGLSYPLYIRSSDWPRLEELIRSPQRSTRSEIIGPLDNLLWDRKLVQELFGFAYTWEVYKPKAERQYGYYVLPILYGDLLVARFDPGRDKGTKELVIQNWWWEQGVKPTSAMKRSIQACFKRFCKFLDAPGIRLECDHNGLDWIL